MDILLELLIRLLAPRIGTKKSKLFYKRIKQLRSESWFNDLAKNDAFAMSFNLDFRRLIIESDIDAILQDRNLTENFRSDIIRIFL
ncbi:hypothetical protein ACSVDA_09055 [Cytobacillus sp. Hm23]